MNGYSGSALAVGRGGRGGRQGVRFVVDLGLARPQRHLLRAVRGGDVQARHARPVCRAIQRGTRRRVRPALNADPALAEDARATVPMEPADAAGLLIAMVEGYGSLAKNAQDPKVMKAGIRNIVDWLRSLRAPDNRKGG